MIWIFLPTKGTNEHEGFVDALVIDIWEILSRELNVLEKEVGCWGK